MLSKQDWHIRISSAYKFAMWRYTYTIEFNDSLLRVIRSLAAPNSLPVFPYPRSEQYVLEEVIVHVLPTPLK